MSAQATAIVTGGSAGIGRAISERLAADGARVAILARNLDTAEVAAVQIRTAGGDARAWSVDVTDRARLIEAVADVRAELGPPTILVNNAGAGAFGPFLEITREEWDAQLALNLTSAFDCCQAVVPDMLTAGWGRIVNISSSSVHSGVPRMTHYVAAKSGMVGFTKALALELAPHGITVNTIPPGFVETPLLRLHAEQGKFDLDEQIARTPVGRPGRPRGHRGRVCVPRQRRSELHHRADHRRQRRPQHLSCVRPGRTPPRADGPDTRRDSSGNRRTVVTRTPRARSPAPLRFQRRLRFVERRETMAMRDSGWLAVLCDYWTGERLRPATAEELAASEQSGPRGVIVVGNRACYAHFTRPAW